MSFTSTGATNASQQVIDLTNENGDMVDLTTATTRRSRQSPEERRFVSAPKRRRILSQGSSSMPGNSLPVPTAQLLPQGFVGPYNRVFPQGQALWGNPLVPSGGFTRALGKREVSGPIIQQQPRGFVGPCNRVFPQGQALRANPLVPTGGGTRALGQGGTLVQSSKVNPKFIDYGKLPILGKQRSHPRIDNALPTLIPCEAFADYVPDSLPQIIFNQLSMKDGRSIGIKNLQVLLPFLENFPWKELNEYWTLKEYALLSAVSLHHIEAVKMVLQGSDNYYWGRNSNKSFSIIKAIMQSVLNPENKIFSFLLKKYQNEELPEEVASFLKKQFESDSAQSIESYGLQKYIIKSLPNKLAKSKVHLVLKEIVSSLEANLTSSSWVLGECNEAFRVKILQQKQYDDLFTYIRNRYKEYLKIKNSERELSFLEKAEWCSPDPTEIIKKIIYYQNRVKKGYRCLPGKQVCDFFKALRWLSEKHALMMSRYCVFVPGVSTSPGVLSFPTVLKNFVSYYSKEENIQGMWKGPDAVDRTLTRLSNESKDFITLCYFHQQKQQRSFPPSQGDASLLANNPPALSLLAPQDSFSHQTSPSPVPSNDSICSEHGSRVADPSVEKDFLELISNLGESSAIDDDFKGQSADDETYKDSLDYFLEEHFGNSASSFSYDEKRDI